MRALAALALATGLALAPAAAHAAAVEAVFMNACSPSDQLALQVNIPAPDGNRLEVRLWNEAMENLASGQFHMLSMNPQQVTVSRDVYLCGEARCEQAKAQLRVGTYRARDFFDGELIWHSRNGVISIPFVAHYADVPNPCG